MDNYCNEKGRGTDAVSHPRHYTEGAVECIDAIRSALGDGFVPYCVGRRYRMKGGAEDLEKARVYLDWAIEAEAEGAKEEFIPIDELPAAFERATRPLTAGWWSRETTRRASEKEGQ